MWARHVYMSFFMYVCEVIMCESDGDAAATENHLFNIEYKQHDTVWTICINCISNHYVLLGGIVREK